MRQPWILYSLLIVPAAGLAHPGSHADYDLVSAIIHELSEPAALAAFGMIAAVLSLCGIPGWSRRQRDD